MLKYTSSNQLPPMDHGNTTTPCQKLSDLRRKLCPWRVLNVYGTSEMHLLSGPMNLEKDENAESLDRGAMCIDRGPFVEDRESGMYRNDGSAWTSTLIIPHREVGRPILQ
ncbi:hypothetical protein CEXT_136941 [Caerostris extrusa]|uniref:AMP-dependent synthetase/ligase domain-containing protein n=1 Tax=Caerostris extrusa TaxID=172846 RepID=A0AAV4U7H0_CAEEX|nr:hypothetical protein CEXT_136941 [Caerostris extrusa]